jgi:hypothetical protein
VATPLRSASRRRSWRPGMTASITEDPGKARSRSSDVLGGGRPTNRRNMPPSGSAKRPIRHEARQVERPRAACRCIAKCRRASSADPAPGPRCKARLHRLEAALPITRARSSSPRPVRSSGDDIFVGPDQLAAIDQVARTTEPSAAMTQASRCRIQPRNLIR